jgi:two-component system NtrC family sensor kinase
MRGEFRPRFATLLVGFLTIALGVLACLNYVQQRKYQPPYDGVTWEDGANGVFARQVEAGGPADRAGVRAGDLLTAINGVPIPQTLRVSRMLYRVGSWGQAEYALVRGGQRLTANVIPEPRDSRSPIDAYRRIVALLYLAIGLFVVLRRAQAPRALHFYLFCLVSFVLYSYRYTEKLNNFDWTIYWGNVIATLLQPALFLHFALVFPEPKEWVKRRRWLVPAVYAPAALLLLVQAAIFTGVLEVRAPAALVAWWLDRIAYAHLAALFLAGAGVLYYGYRRAETPLARQQMKWLTRGVALGIVPFASCYAVPYLFGALSSGWIKLAVLSLAFIPLTFGYAIARYRLMDVDVLFRRGVAYTLATMVLVGLYFTAIALIAAFFSSNLPATGTTGLVIAMVVSAFLFQPLRLRIQERLDRYFYREGYDYRRTLGEFGRELSSETDLDRMLGAVVERLSRTLTVDKVGVFLVDKEGRANLAHSLGLSFAGELDLRFLDPARPEMARGCLFFDSTRQAPGESEAARASIAALDLHYYVRCRAQGRTVAFLGLGKTAKNDFLSSEDVALVETLSGYLGAAVDNAQLYQSLKRKAAEYERLKDFNENIIESINMGILVLDLDDRIESWNTQLELMYGLSRDQAYGRPIDEVFPADLMADLVRFRGDEGIHNLYKHGVRTPSGEQRVLNIAVAPLVSKNFELIGRLLIFDDITEQVELEQQLVQAEKLSSIGLLAAGVAHEVNTPLSVISSYAQLLAKQLPAEQHGKLLDKIIKSTFRASEIVNNLLNFSRTGSAEMGPLDLNAVVRDTLALLDHTLKASGVRAETELSGEPALVDGNTGKLQQVFLNLFLNARDAMPNGGVLRVSTRTEESAVLMEVADTGLGIARENIQRIYDPFFTTKPARAGGNGGNGGLRSGTGLGLAVTYGIIKEHSGKIRVESSPGRGARFLLEFPRSRKAVGV